MSSGEETENIKVSLVHYNLTIFLDKGFSQAYKCLSWIGGSIPCTKLLDNIF